MKNFKKVISAVIALALSASTLVSAASFTDVAKTAPYAEAVDVLSSLGIINGYEDGTFRPEGEITRAEAATMIVGALNMTADAQNAAGETQFADVNEQAAWATGYINVGVSQKFINGMGDGTFAPQANVTYAQMCVMLTSIAGYAEYAAKDGYPKGYTDMAKSTGINKGVAVGNDVALTRGQVAQMIYNTLTTPMLGVSEYSVVGNTYAPLDGKGTPAREFKTLLSDKFNGYTATILVANTPVADSSLESDEFQFNIQKADWWYDATAPITVATGTLDGFFAEGVDVNGNNKKIGKAVFVANEDDEPTLVYFAETGKTDSKDLEAADYVAQSELAAKNQFEQDNSKVRFGTKYYTLEANVDVYVNGIDYADIVNDDVDDDDKDTLTESQLALDNFLGNAIGTITLLDTNTEATGYNTIFVEIWNVAKVAGVDVENGQTVVSMTTKNAITGAADYDEIVINDEAIEDKKTVVSVEKNGQAADLKSLVKGDIIAYKSDIGAAGETALTDPSHLEIIATNDVASGKVTGSDGDAKTFTVGGTAYETVVWNASLLTMGESYKLTLDPFGRIYEAEQDGSSDMYAIALDVVENTVKLILADGTYKSYELASGAVDGFTAADDTETSTTLDSYLAGKTAAQRVVKYSVRNKTGAISKIQPVAATAVTDEYKSRTNRLGSFEILSTTNVIDATKAASAGASDASSYTKFNVENFKDNTNYDFAAVKVNTYTALVVVTAVGEKFNSESRFAVVRKAPASVETEDGPMDEVEVLYGTDEEAKLIFNEDVYSDHSLAVGDAFFYELDAYGYVSDVFRVYEAATGTFTALKDVAGVGAGDLELAPSANECWAFDLVNSDRADIQLVEAYVIPGSNGVITLAEVNGDLLKIDTTKDLAYYDHDEDPLTDDISNNGIAIYSVAADVQAYLYNKSNDTIVKEYDKLSVKNDVSVLASTSLDKYLENGIYEHKVGGVAQDMAGEAIKAIAMIVDDVVVQIYAIK